MENSGTCAPWNTPIPKNSDTANFVHENKVCPRGTTAVPAVPRYWRDQNRSQWTPGAPLEVAIHMHFFQKWTIFRSSHTIVGSSLKLEKQILLQKGTQVDVSPENILDEYAYGRMLCHTHDSISWFPDAHKRHIKYVHVHHMKRLHFEFGTCWNLLEPVNRVPGMTVWHT